jgi:hypothetical protein
MKICEACTLNEGRLVYGNDEMHERDEMPALFVKDRQFHPGLYFVPRCEELEWRGEINRTVILV